MALTENGGDGMVMPVAPMMYGNGGGFGGNWTSDWWIIFILLFAFGGFGGWGNGWGGFGGAGNAVADLTLPYFFNNTDNGVQSGFNQAATNSALAGIQTSLTNGFAGVEVNACNRAADAMATAYNNQIASMNQNFSNQLALNSQLDGIQNSISATNATQSANTADLKYTVATEACADRAAVKDALNSVLVSMNSGIQSIKDQISADKLDAKNEQIQALQAQVNMQNLAASQAAQTAQLLADNNAQTSYIVNRVAPYPQPAIVYGYNTSWINGNGCNSGCGCGNF